MSQNNRVQHQNQFLVCDSTFEPTPPVGFSHAEFTDELDVYHSETLPVFQASDGDN
ncbi:hypothetical protein ACFFQF_11240 [Haladaptatus pallidirubidus]|uniref:Uncharacterized protein n=1 Tax=Haladaptatus pallidirubidus TaxID=1008152 RepID=A0AAV3UEH6_9EURY|nr:hypothetical protein [Haladaptatus pallidirubidus]